jgi:hypothetical protein
MNSVQLTDFRTKARPKSGQRLEVSVWNYLLSANATQSVLQTDRRFADGRWQKLIEQRYR